jgi:methyl-accepting chemotaxis protein
MIKSSLRTKLLLSVGVIIFIVLGTSTLLHIRDLQRDYLEALEWRSEALAQSLGSNVIEKYKLNPSINEMLGVFSIQCVQIYELNQEKNVTHVAVINASNVIAAHNDKTLWNTSIESPVLLNHLSRHNLTTVLDGTIYHTLVPIVAENDIYLGTIDIGFSKRLVDEKIQQLLRQSSGLFVLFVVVAFTATSVLIHLVVTKPIRHLITMGKKIARGELVHTMQSDAGNTISRSAQGDSPDEIWTLTAVFHDMIAYLHDMASAATRIATGDLSQRITPCSKDDVLGTAFQRMSTYLNTMASAATTIAKGDLRQEIQPNTEHDVLAVAFHEMIRRLNEILQEIDRLTQAVQNGKLSTRGNAEVFAGGWRDLVVGVNNVIDALVTPINVTTAYLDRLSKGDIPEAVTQEYKGDFNTIKQNLNVLIDTMDETTHLAEEIAVGNLMVEVKERSEHDRLMQALNRMIRRLNATVQELDDLVHAVQNGKLDTRGHAERFDGIWRDLVVGINALIDAFGAPITMAAESLDRIAQGDIPEKISTEYHGDFNTIKHNLNTLIETMKNLLKEMNRLILAVQEGKLETHGNAEHFVGEWRELVVGINNVIDAFMRPITMAATTIDRIAKGDIPNKITDTYQGDFNAIKQNLNMLIEATNDVTRLAQDMAAGNLTIEVKERSDQDTLMQALNTMIQRLKEVVIQVKSAADNVAAGSQEMQSSSEEMSEGAAQQASAAEEVSSSMEEMAANIRQNADNAKQTERIALQSAEYAEESGKVVAETVVAMKQIAQKILIIEEIADQTRMLSLNATIEAARAQEHGKPFSVVASEVRKLSDVTKKAAEEIKQLATSSLDISEKAGKMLATLLPSIRKTTELVQEISIANNEQSTEAEHINTAIQQLDQVTQQNAIGSENVATAAEELAAQAEQLRNIMQFFKIEATPSEAQDKGKQETRSLRSRMVTETMTETQHPHPEVKRIPNKGDDSPAGYKIALNQQEEGGDEQDAEFERY